jgi:prevent-host-death family protein
MNIALVEQGKQMPASPMRRAFLFWEAPNQTRPGLWYLPSMVVRNISQAKAELSALIEEVLKGNEVILAKSGKPVARLVAYRGPSRPRTPVSMAGDISVAADFDSLPDDIAEAFGMPERVR